MSKVTLDRLEFRGRRCEHDAVRLCVLARRFVLGLTLAATCQSALAQALYRITPLGYLPGGCSSIPSWSDFNRSNKVTGTACNANGDFHGFLWKNDGSPMVDLGPPEVGSQSDGNAISASGLVTGDAHDSTGDFAFVSDGTHMTRIRNGLGGRTIYPADINDLGQLTGDAYTTGNTVYHAFVWKNDGSPMLDLGTFGGSTSSGIAINASGQVAGSANLSGDAVQHAFVWKNDGSPLLDLGTLGGNSSGALFINASGQVAGNSDTAHGSHAFFWRNDGTPIKDLGTLGGPYVGVAALNDSGQIAGSSYTHKPGALNAHAFVWLNDGTSMKDLGTLGGFRSAAQDLNSSGQATGYADLVGDKKYHAFLWRNDGTKIQDLNKLIDPTDPLQPYITLTVGEFINDLGNIVAVGTDSRTGHGDLYLLQGTVLTLNPRALAFANQRIKTASPAKTVTMTNTSPKAAAVTNVALTGAAASQFASTNNCGKSLAGHATCTIKVTFKPTTKGAKSGFLNVNGGGGGLRTVALTGTGA